MAWRERLATAQGVARSLLIYYGLPWRPARLRRLYRAYIQPGDVAFDIGAHVGNRTRVLAQLGAQVIAVEPQPALVGVLRRLYGRDRRVTIVAAAVGADVGTADLYISRRTPTVSSVAPAWIARVGATPGFAGVRWEAPQRVAQTTLDALIAQHGRPAFCKIDVEGHEAAVLAGLSQPLPALAFEYVPAALHAAHACLDRLAALGDYRYAVTVGEAGLPGGWLTADALRAWLDARPPAARAGDIYARLITEER